MYIYTLYTLIYLFISFSRTHFPMSFHLARTLVALVPRSVKRRWPKAMLRPPCCWKSCHGSIPWRIWMALQLLETEMLLMLRIVWKCWNWGIPITSLMNFHGEHVIVWFYLNHGISWDIGVPFFGHAQMMQVFDQIWFDVRFTVRKAVSWSCFLHGCH